MAKGKKRKLDHQTSKIQIKKLKQKPSKEIKSASDSGKSSGTTISFEAEDRILLVGEGDFSFAKSIVEHHRCCDVTATCLDSKDDLYVKYKPQAEENIQYLEGESQTVLYNVDATKLDSIKSLKSSERFDKIIFNFPHIGGKSTDVNRQVRSNQELLVKFFKSASQLLKASGSIIVTLFESEPYTLWNIRDLARHSGLEVQRSFKFQPSAYPAYRHSRTLGNIDGGGGWKGENREARSYEFRQKSVQTSPKDSKEVNKRRRRSDDSDSDND